MREICERENLRRRGEVHVQAWLSPTSAEVEPHTGPEERRGRERVSGEIDLGGSGGGEKRKKEKEKKKNKKEKKRKKKKEKEKKRKEKKRKEIREEKYTAKTFKFEKTQILFYSAKF